MPASKFQVNQGTIFSISPPSVSQQNGMKMTPIPKGYCKNWMRKCNSSIHHRGWRCSNSQQTKVILKKKKERDLRVDISYKIIIHKIFVGDHSFLHVEFTVCLLGRKKTSSLGECWLKHSQRNLFLMSLLHFFFLSYFPHPPTPHRPRTTSGCLGAILSEGLQGSISTAPKYHALSC